MGSNKCWLDEWMNGPMAKLLTLFQRVTNMRLQNKFADYILGAVSWMLFWVLGRPISPSSKQWEALVGLCLCNLALRSLLPGCHGLRLGCQLGWLTKAPLWLLYKKTLADSSQCRLQDTVIEVITVLPKRVHEGGHNPPRQLSVGLHRSLM